MIKAWIIKESKKGKPSLTALATVTILLVLITFAHAQNSQFLFDFNGNLQVQSSELNTSPQIAGQPQNQVVDVGENASFMVVATGTKPLSYQWRFNNTNIAATTETLLLLNVSTNNEGQYSVVVTNAFGSVTSVPALLMIDSDHDGMSDAWELAYFGNLDRNGASDFDFDGNSNRREFQDGTDPTDPNSVAYRLLVIQDLGSVIRAPDLPAYTNGQSVTLTAVPPTNGIFHAWLGAIITRSNPVTIVMTRDKTVYARFTPIVFTWTNIAGGDWNTPSNWKPNLAPSTNDTAIINTTTTVTLNTAADCADVTLGDADSYPTLTGTGTLAVRGEFAWGSGVLSGTGKTIIETGGILNFVNRATVALVNRTLENGGMAFWTDVGGLEVQLGAVITNRAGALFEFQSPATISSFLSFGRFDNAGTFRKSNGSATTTLGSGVSFNNYGTVDVQTGALVIGAGGSASGTFAAPATTVVEWSGGTFTLNSGAQLNGAGLYRLNGSATVTANTSLDVTNIDLVSVSATLGGTGAVSVLNVMNWTAGSMSSTGVGRTIIPSGATLNIANSSPVFLSTRTLEIGGTASWTGAGGFVLNSGGVLTNRGGALFAVQGAGGFGVNVGSGRIDNAGTFRKSGSSSVTSVFSGVAFNSSGTVEILAGTLNLAGGGTHTASSTVTGPGHLAISGGSMSFAGLVNVSGSNSFTGVNSFIPETINFTGTYFCTNNTLTIAGNNNVNFNGTASVSPAVIDLKESGVLAGSNTVTVLNTMNWTGGTMSGSGRTIIPAEAVLTIGGVGGLGISGRTLENGGTILWASPAFISVTGSGVITNRPGGLFHAQNASSVGGGIANGRFDNAGIFRKSISAGNIAFASGMALNNFGTVQLQTGTLDLGGGGTHSGNFEVAANSMLILSSGAHNANGSSSITGAGHLTVSAGIVNLAGLVNISGSNTFSGGFNGGTFNLTGNYICTNNTLTVSGNGTANFNGPGLISPTVLNLKESGVLAGSSPVTALAVMNWTGGSMSGNGRTIIAPGATATVTSSFATTLPVFGRTLDNGGSLVWSGPANLNLLTGAVITNRPGGLFHVQNATSMGGSGASRFDNAGTFRKSSNVGTTTFGGVSFNNYGTVDIRSGILAANGGYASSASAVLNCALGGLTAGIGYGQVQVAGSVSLAGNLSVSLTNNFIPPVNSTYTVLSAGTRNGSFANFFYPSNSVDMVMSNTPNSVVVRALGPYFTTTTLPDAVRNVGYTQQVTAIMSNGPIVYSIISGAVPTGLSLSGGGLISGIPTVFGNSIFTVQASNVAGVTIQQAFNLKVRNLPPEGLISWWRAENNALDFISTNHGVLTNGTSFATGNVGQTFSLDGVNDYVHVPDSPGLRPASLTLEAWAMFNSPNGPVFCKPLGPTTGDSFALYLLGGTLNGFIHDTNAAGVLVSSPSPLTLGQWHHVAFTFDNSTKEQALYVNGVRVATSQSNRSIGYDNRPVLLGQDINNGVFDFPLNGRIDEAAIYNRALSPNEIAAIYNAGGAGKPVNAPYFVTAAQLPDAALMVGYTQQVSAILGTGPITFIAPSGGLPVGLSLSPDGTISGIPSVAGTNSFVVRATDSLSSFTDQQTTLRVIAPVPAPSGLISWWRAEGNALDSAGTNHGTASNGVVYVQGKVGQGFGFDGINDFVWVPDATNLRPTAITLEAWATFNGNQGPVFGRSWGAGIHNSYVIWQLSGNINGTIGDTNQAADILTTSFAPAPGEWYHLAYTFDDATKQQALYLNGAIVASGQSFRAIGYDSHPVVIGGDIDNGSVSFLLNGGVDEAAIYNRALTANEITGIYNAGIAGKRLVTAVPQPTFLAPELVGSDIKLTWTAIPSATYRLEFNPDLANPGNWIAVPGDVTASTNTASKLDALTTSNRLYRVRVLP